MKTLKAVMAIAMVIILASCGKSFDAERAQQLCDKFETEEALDEKEWNELADLYENLIEYRISILNTNLKKAEKGMSMKDVEELSLDKDEIKKFYDIKYDIESVLYEGRKDMPNDVKEQVRASEEKYHNERSKIEEEIRKKIEG